MRKRQDKNREKAQNDLLRYVYHELEGEEKAGMEQMVFSDGMLEDEFYALIDLKGALDRIEPKGRPSKGSIDRIMQFSSSFHSVEQ